MKKSIILAFFLFSFFVGPTFGKAEIAIVKSDPPPTYTWYCGTIYWGGGNLPAGTYEVLSNLSDHSQVLYLYDSYNVITYNCFLSLYDETTHYASLYVMTPNGDEFIGYIYVNP